VRVCLGRRLSATLTLNKKKNRTGTLRTLCSVSFFIACGVAGSILPSCLAIVPSSTQLDRMSRLVSIMLMLIVRSKYSDPSDLLYKYLVPLYKYLHPRPSIKAL